MPAPKVTSKAQELARQAAEAALAEVQETEAAAAPSGTWRPPALPQDFQLDAALALAVQRAAGHLQRLLGPEGLEVAPAQHPSPQAAPSMAGQSPSAATEPAGVQVREGQTGRMVRGYSTGAVLGLFATQQQRSGVVVDGQV